MCCLIVLIFTLSLIFPAFAQNTTNNTSSRQSIVDKALELDNELNPTITATLTGLSLTGASFLMSLTQSGNVGDKNKIHLIKKYFIKAFFMFLLCTLSLFVFDFIEILEKNIVLYVLLDVVITFLLFGIGVIYLARAAKLLYSTYGR